MEYIPAGYTSDGAWELNAECWAVSDESRHQLKPPASTSHMPKKNQHKPCRQFSPHFISLICLHVSF